MYVIRDKETHTLIRHTAELTLRLINDEVRETRIRTFETKAQAKHFMRNKKIILKGYDIIFMTRKELEMN